VTLVAGEPRLVSIERRLHWSYVKPTYDEQWDGRTLRVATHCSVARWLGPPCGVDYRLTVPKAVSIHVRTTTGDVEVRNLAGELRLSTSTGDITAVDIGSPVVEASTGTGDIRLTHSAPPQTVSVRTTTGDVSIRVPDGGSYRVQADTGVGDTQVSVPRSARRRVPSPSGPARATSRSASHADR
jgi:hypothetical protein